MSDVLIIPDSFKGSLTSSQAAQTIEKALKELYPNIESCIRPLADGGEGTLEVISHIIPATKHWRQVEDPMGRIIKTYYLTYQDTAYIELAAASGLTLLDKSELNVMKASTFGTGQLIADAIAHGYQNITLALGGSATNDAALGILKALGYTFFGANGDEYPITRACAEDLHNIYAIKPTHENKKISSVHFTLLCDVTNPLLGPHGAAPTFAPQKGVSPDMIKELETALSHWNDLLIQATGLDMSDRKGAGAAGGVSATFMALFKAHYQSGIDFLMKKMHLEQEIRDTKLIITGEGCIDKQSLDGKLLSGIIQQALPYNKPIIAFAGKVTLPSQPNLTCISITPDNMPIHEAMQTPIAQNNLYNAVKHFFQNITL